ncbi:MAG: hypothetical protein WD895_07655 [Acidimicrobiia bacterium]
MFFLWLVLIHEYGSSRKVEEAFEDVTHGPWAQIRRAAERQFGRDRSDLIPPERPPSRNQFNYALKHHLPHHTEAITALIKIRSAEVALAVGLGSPASPGSVNQPSLERVAFGDVTVMTARTRRTRRDARQVNKTTGEIINHRHDPDARRHTTGGGSVVTGLPWAFTHVRGSHRNQQVILAVDPVIPKSTTEGHLVVDQYLASATHLTGLVGYAYDRALRGVHLDRLLKAGHIGLVGVHQSKGEPADRYHGIETHHHANGTQTEVEIHLVGGAPHLRVYDVDGNPQLHPLHRRRIKKRYNRKTNDYRLSAEYDVVIDSARNISDGYIRIRLDQTAEDRLRGYNRTEHLRAFPETDPVFTRIQRPLRASAESANRTIDDHLPRERLHHYGFEKNQLSMLAWQAYRNAQTEAVFTPRGRVSSQPAWPLAA